MKSAIFQRPNEASICDIPEPQVLEPDDVKIKVIYTSICADDTAAFTQFRERVTPGHEFSGIIVDLGKTAAMTGLAVGDKVTGYTWRFCGKCRFCRAGKENLCVNLALTGAMQEYILLKDNQVCKIAPELSMQEGCLFELVASCIHGIRRANLQMGDTVLILGGGGAGMILTQLARLSGASRIVVSEPLASKRELCLQFGADLVLNPYLDQMVASGLAITDGLGFDCILDASKNKEAVQEALPLLSKGGTLLLFSFYNLKSRIDFSLPMMYTGELTVRTSYMAPYLMEYTMRTMLRLNLKPLLVSNPFSLDQVQEAFETAFRSRLPRVFMQVNKEP